MIYYICGHIARLEMVTAMFEHGKSDCKRSSVQFFI
jgi:hypothetical protein